MLKIFAFALLIASASAFWSACTDLPDVVSADNVTGSSCSRILNRCIATRGSTLTLEVFFTPRIAHSQLASRGAIQHNQLPADVPVIFTPPNDNACSNLYNAETREITACPTTPDVQKLWIVNMAIPNTPGLLPAVPGATLRVSLLSNDVVVGCTNVRIDVV